MSIPLYDPDLNVIKCADGSCDDTCTTDGCEKLFAIGPCSAIVNAINPANGAANIYPYVSPADLIFDANTWCQVNSLKNTTLDLNRTDREEGYLHDCFITTKTGRMRPTVSAEIDYCREDEAHCLLQSASAYGCLIAFMCMEKRSEFLPNVSANQQPDITYGIARVGSTPVSNTFDQADNRTYTLTIHKYMWMFNTCLSATQLKALEYKTPEKGAPLTAEQKMLSDSLKLDKAA